MEYMKGGNSPFLEEIDTELFFSGGNRKSLLDEIKDAIAGNVAVITLVGEEGDGKSHLCKMILKERTDGVFSVYLPDPLESYEDVIRIVAQEMNISLREQDELGGAGSLLEEILKRLDESDRNLLLLFDQAEQIYLATLERIRKMVDQANRERVRFQILLSGRKILKDNLQQLEMCSFEGAEEKHFSLTPLNVSETYDYLNFCMQYGEGEIEKEVFTREAAEKIFSIGHGNFRMTNILAEESLESLSSDTSFLVLLDNVRDGEKSEPPKNISRFSAAELKGQLPLLLEGLKTRMPQLFAGLRVRVIDFAAEIKRRMPVSFKDLLEQREWALGAGGGLVLILILFVMIFSGSDEGGDEQSIVESPQVEVEYKEVAGSPERSMVPPKELSQEEAQPLPREIIDEVSGGEQTDTAAQDSKVLDKEMPPQVVVGRDAEEAMADRASVDQVQAPVQEALLTESQEIPSEESGENELPKEQADKKVAIAASGEGSVSVDALENVNEQVVSYEEKEQVGATIRVEPLEAVPTRQEQFPILGGNGTVSKKVAKKKTPRDSVDKIYDRRVVASAKWWVGEQQGQYTVQLMALTSDKAEANLKKMLTQKEYQEVSDDLFILRKKTTTLTILVFFGEFQTLEEARKAKESLPEFLRKHQPYAISVAGAVKKAGSG